MPGPDGIPTALLFHCREALALPVSFLFNLSLSTSTFPKIWKQAWIRPVFKKGDRGCVSNYRGISILSAFSKVFESVIRLPLMEMVKSWIIPNQHGFMAGRSTTTNLMEFVSSVLLNLDSDMQVDAVYTDFKAAFDKITHSLLIAKFKKLGFSPFFLEWLQSFLSNRFCCVKLNDGFSYEFHCSSGIPQGLESFTFYFICQ